MQAVEAATPMLGTAAACGALGLPRASAPARGRRAFLFPESDVLCAPWVVTSFWNEPFLAGNTYSYTGSPPEFQLTVAPTL